jgi:hypothetical protein
MSNRIKILFLAADPSDFTYKLALGNELNQIKREIALEANRDRIEVVAEFAVTPEGLLKALRDHQPNVVHFSGHGGDDGIILQNDAGAAYSVSKEGLAALFRKHKATVRLVFLNACYSEPQVQAFKHIINFTIGMRNQVMDDAAISFAGAFYSALSFGRSVEAAFEEAKILLKLTRQGPKNPMMFKGPGADANVPFVNCVISNGTQSANGPAQSLAVTEEEPQVCLWVHGWIKRLYDRRPTVQLDWTSHFQRDLRKIPGQQVWKLKLFEDLQTAKKKLDRQEKGAFIDFRGKLPLTASLAIGSKFPEVGGYRFRAEQPTRGKTVLWRSDATPSKRKFDVLITKRRRGVEKQNLLVGLAITGSARDDVEALYNQRPKLFSALIYAEPEHGPGDGALRSDKDAVALAIHAKDLIRKYKVECKASQTHLVVYAPASYCLFLGQHLNALGTIVTYERASNEEYQPSVTLQTG